MVKTFKVSEGANGYGPRIWLDESERYTETAQKLNVLSVWGGIDKSADGMVSWEFADQLYLAKAIIMLGSEGFTLDM